MSQITNTKSSTVLCSVIKHTGSGKSTNRKSRVKHCSRRFLYALSQKRAQLRLFYLFYDKKNLCQIFLHKCAFIFKTNSADGVSIPISWATCFYFPLKVRVRTLFKPIRARVTLALKYSKLAPPLGKGCGLCAVHVTGIYGSYQYQITSVIRQWLIISCGL